MKNTQYRNQESKKESEHFLPVRARNPVSSYEEKYSIGLVQANTNTSTSRELQIETRAEKRGNPVFHIGEES